MVNDRPVVSVVMPGVTVEWSMDADNQASGWAYGSAGVGGSLIIGQTGVWSVGGRLIIVVRVL